MGTAPWTQMPTNQPTKKLRVTTDAQSNLTSLRAISHSSAQKQLL